MNEFFTPDVLLTFTGQVLFVTTATQILKRYIPKIDPKWIALVLAFGISFAAQVFFRQDVSPAGFVMTAVNALAVLSGAVMGYESAVKPAARIMAARHDALLCVPLESGVLPAEEASPIDLDPAETLGAPEPAAPPETEATPEAPEPDDPGDPALSRGGRALEPTGEAADLTEGEGDSGNQGD